MEDKYAINSMYAINAMRRLEAAAGSAEDFISVVGTLSGNDQFDTYSADLVGDLDAAVSAVNGILSVIVRSDIRGHETEVADDEHQA